MRRQPSPSTTAQPTLTPSTLLVRRLKSDDETTVLHEAALKRLQELKRTDGRPVLWMPERLDEAGSGVWMKLARPDDEDTRKTPLGQAA